MPDRLRALLYALEHVHCALPFALDFRTATRADLVQLGHTAQEG